MSLWSCDTSIISKTLEDAVPQSFSSNLPKWEWRREKLSTLMEALGACCVLRFTLLIVTGIYVSVTIQLGSWISFSTTGSINFLNFSTLRKSGTEWKSGSWSGSMQHRHLGLRCEAQPGVVLWAPQVRYSPLMWWLCCCSAAEMMLLVSPELCQLPCHPSLIVLNHPGKVWWLNTVEHKVSSALWCFEREDEESTLLLNFFLSHSVAVTSTALEWKGRTGMGFEVTIRVLVAPSPNMNIISKSKTFKFVEITWNLNIDC